MRTRFGIRLERARPLLPLAAARARRAGAAGGGRASRSASRSCSACWSRTRASRLRPSSSSTASSGSARIQLAARSADGFDERIARARERRAGRSDARRRCCARTSPFVGPRRPAIDPAHRGHAWRSRARRRPDAGLRPGRSAALRAGSRCLPASPAAIRRCRPGAMVTVLAGGRCRARARSAACSVLARSARWRRVRSRSRRCPSRRTSPASAGRVSQLLVQPQPGPTRRSTRRAARASPHGRLFVRPADSGAAAARPDRQAERPVHDAVRRDQRDGRLPARAQRDADDGSRASALRRGAAHAGLRSAAGAR